jgi:hypothetical protein
MVIEPDEKTLTMVKSDEKILIMHGRAEDIDHGGT